MEVPRIEHGTARGEPWPDAYVAPTDDQPARTPEEEDELRELEDLFWTLDLGPRHRVELLDGRIEVSPRPTRWHERVVMWLIRRFDPVCEENGWEPTPGADLRLPPNGDIIEPDYIIATNPDAIPDDHSVVPHDHALLVAEICSPSSIRQDRVVKPMKCAKAGIPFYLLVDRFTEPKTVTLMSDPGKQGYRRIETVHAGANGESWSCRRRLGSRLMPRRCRSSGLRPLSARIDMTDIEALKGALRRDLAGAMKGRDRDAAAVLRTALAALDNAEAVTVPADGQVAAAGAHVAGASGGVGSTEAERRAVTGDQAREILRGLVAEQSGEADRYDTLGQAAAAQRLRAQAGVLERYIG